MRRLGNNFADTRERNILPWLALSIGIFGIVCYIAKIKIGVLLSDSFAPMQFNSCVSAVLLSLAMIAIQWQKFKLSRTLALVGSVLPALTIFEWISGATLGIDQLFGLSSVINQHASEPGRMSFMAASGFLCLSLFLAVPSQKSCSQRQLTFAGICTAFISTLYTYIFALSTFHVEVTFGVRITNSISPQTCVAVVTLATSILLRIKQKTRTQNWSMRWIALPVGLGIATGTFFLWQAQNRLDDEHHRQIAKDGANSLSNLYHSRIKSTIQSLNRMARRIEVGSESTFDSWQPDASFYIKDEPAFQAVEWIDKDLKIRWVEPLAGNEKALTLNIKFEPTRKSAVQQAVVQGKTSVSKVINLVQGGKGFLVYCPVFQNGKFHGMVAGVIKADSFFANLPKNVGQDIEFDIQDEGTTIYHSENLASNFHPMAVDTITNEYGLKWIVRVAARTKTSPLGSPLSVIMLISGLIVALLASMTFLSLEQITYYRRQDQVNRAFVEGIMDASPAPIFVLELESGAISYRNKRAASLWPNLSTRSDLTSCLDDLDVPKLDKQLQDMPSVSDHEVQCLELRFFTHGEEVRTLVQHMTVLRNDPSGEFTQVLFVGQDVTHLRSAQDELVKNNSDLKAIFDHAPIGMAIVAPDGTWSSANNALEQILGYTEEEMLSLNFQSITHPEDLEADLNLVQKTLAGEIDSYTIEKRYFHKSGKLVWANLTVMLIRNAEGKPKHFVSQIQDISEAKLSELLREEYTSSLKNHSEYLSSLNTQLEAESRTDQLTGLRNRRAFDEHFETCHASATRYHRPLSLLVIDIDHFKRFNDDYGHHAGDYVLQLVAAAVQSQCRTVDFASRWGGEEMAVLCPETQLGGACEFAERIRQAVSEIDTPFRRVTVSIGVSTLRPEDAESMFERADRALYLAKESGRNQVKSDQDCDPKAA